MQLTLFKNQKTKKIAVIVFTIILFALVSLLAIYQTEIYQGKIWSYLGTSDNRFHMMRIEGLYHSLQRHQFFPFINMSFMNGFGYIVNIFYSDFLLYPAAFLRLLGFTSAQTIVIYFWLLNFLTFGVAFLCYYKVSPKYLNSLVFSFVYTLSTYRLHDMLFRQDIGEVGAFIFLPIAVLGIYEIFYGERKHWLYLVFGMTGIIYSHAISPILVAVFIVIVALAQIKTLKAEPQRLLSLLWATLCSGLLSLAYFIPMMEQVRHTKFVLTQTSSLLPKGATDMADMVTWSLNNNIGQPNIGLLMIITAFVLIISFTKIKNPILKQFSVIGILLLLGGTKVMPWVIFNNTPFKMIQYPWRFDMIATILLAIVIAADPLNFFTSKYAKVGLMTLVFLFAMSSSYRLVNGAPLQRNTYAEYNEQEPFSIGAGQEYLPVGTNLAKLQRASHKPKIMAGKAQVTNFKQYGTRLSFDFKHAKNAKVDLPIIAYYGFESTQSRGRVSKVVMDKKNNNLAQVTINGSGKVTVDYFETMAQKVSRRMSFLTLLAIIAIVFINKLHLVDFDKIEGLRNINRSK
ncbi:hypothetical protein [Companilactobacillus nantensis]|uniref:Cell surface protein n=2 Tax=Companilactobacillus nantensis TaxID=305793 RepID=A0A0R1WMG0_9LACO|nr:hypothetical protein [Companilactobacillus nantensis]KRM16262.1 cell surface protein precursor [Companilactobacillus nantensis DSM 16982]